MSEPIIESSYGKTRAANLSASTFSAAISLLAALANVCGRIGLPDLEIHSTLKMLLFACSLIFAGSLLKVISRVFFRRGDLGNTISDAPAILILLILTSIFSCFGSVATPVICCIGVAAILSWIAESLIFSRKSIDPAFWLVTIIFATWAMFKQFHPMFFEELLLGHTDIDTIFDSAIASLIKTFGTCVVGYDGIKIAHTHTGSHWLFGRWSELLHLDLITVCSKGQLIITFPVMIKCFLTFCFDLVSKTNLTGWQDAPKKLAIYFWIFTVGLIGFIPLSLASKMGMYWYTILLTETYSVALAAMFLTLSISVISFDKATEERPSMQSWIVYSFVVPVLLFCTGMAKQSLLYCLLIAFVYLFWRLKLYRRPVFIAGLIDSLILTYVTFRAVYSANVNPIHLFDFFKTYIKGEGYILFPFFYYFWFWCLTLLTLWKCDILSRKNFYDAILSKKLLLSEVLLIVILASQLPPNAIEIPGGSGILFLEPQNWVALAATISMVPFTLRRLKNLVGSRNRGARKFTILVTCSIAAAACAIFFANVSDTVIAGTRNYFTDRLALTFGSESPQVHEFQGRYEAFLSSTKKLRLRSSATNLKAISRLLSVEPKNSLQQDQSYAFLNSVRELYGLSPELKKTNLLYIPRVRTAYWNTLPCLYMHMLSPSLTGFASLAGLPPEGCAGQRLYGLAYYPVPNKTDPLYNSKIQLRLPVILGFVRKRSFDGVYIPTPYTNGHFVRYSAAASNN